MPNQITKPKESKIKGSDVLTVGAIGLGALAAYFIFKGIQSASGSEERIAAMESYENEMEELIAYQNGLADLGRELTNTEVQTLELMMHWIQLKEQNAQAKGWFGDFEEYLSDIGKDVGYIIIYVIAGYAALRLMQYLWRKRGGGGPPNFTCPVDGQTFTDPYAYDTHMRSHMITYDPVKIAEAQATFSQLPAWTQDSIAITSGYYTSIHYDWNYNWNDTFAYDVLVGMSQARAHHEGTVGAMVMLETTIQTLAYVPII